MKLCTKSNTYMFICCFNSKGYMLETPHSKHNYLLVCWMEHLGMTTTALKPSCQSPKAFTYTVNSANAKMAPQQHHTQENYLLQDLRIFYSSGQIITIAHKCSTPFCTTWCNTIFCPSFKTTLLLCKSVNSQIHMGCCQGHNSPPAPEAPRYAGLAGPLYSGFSDYLLQRHIKIGKYQRHQKALCLSNCIYAGWCMVKLHQTMWIFEARYQYHCWWWCPTATYLANWALPV